MFDAKHLGLLDAEIAQEIAKHIDNGEPKPKLSDSVRRGVARIMGRGEVAAKQPAQNTAPANQEPLKNWL